MPRTTPLEYVTALPRTRGGGIIRTAIPQSGPNARKVEAHALHVRKVREALAVADGRSVAPSPFPVTPRPNASVTGARADVRRADITLRRWLDPDAIPAGSAGLFFRVADERARALYFAREWSRMVARTDRNATAGHDATAAARMRRYRSRKAAPDVTPADAELLALRAAADAAARAIDGQHAPAASWQDVKPSRTLSSL